MKWNVSHVTLPNRTSFSYAIVKNSKMAFLQSKPHDLSEVSIGQSIRVCFNLYYFYRRDTSLLFWAYSVGRDLSHQELISPRLKHLDCLYEAIVLSRCATLFSSDGELL